MWQASFAEHLQSRSTSQITTRKSQQVSNEQIMPTGGIFIGMSQGDIFVSEADSD